MMKPYIIHTIYKFGSYTISSVNNRKDKKCIKLLLFELFKLKILQKYIKITI